jgi:hypothetical protein
LLAVIFISGSLVFCDTLGEARTCRDVRRLRFVGGRGIVVLLSDPETSDAADEEKQKKGQGFSP